MRPRPQSKQLTIQGVIRDKERAEAARRKHERERTRLEKKERKQATLGVPILEAE